MANPDYTSRPAETAAEDPLVELALNLRWSFNHSADTLWERLEPELWGLTHNPWLVLQTVSRERLRQAADEPEFRALVEELLKDKRAATQPDGWFRRAHGSVPLTTVAYFSMEFMLSEALPIYSGGLGNVAGDQLKAAGELGVPMVGVGLLYQQGYFRQEINEDGSQKALYPFNDPGQLPITPVRDADGEWVRVRLAFPGMRLWIRAWQARIGRTRLYLLDTNDPANLPAHRGITSELYGGGPDLRIRQEQVLGIGGWRLLCALGLDPEVCHLNEGHAAFAVLERARSFMTDRRQSFERALAATRAGNLFTTHTPVDAGFDRFEPRLMENYFRPYAEEQLGISFDDLLALGRRNPADQSEAFNMAYLALRGSGAVNAVSRLHGQVSRRIFQGLFPRWPEIEVPVSHVTNGVHMPTWDSAAADAVWEAACGKDRWRGNLATIEADFSRVSDATLWEMRAEARRKLVEFVRARLQQQLAGHGASADEIERAGQVFDPDTLVLGFARRFATYKRPNLLLHDPARLARILTDAHRPVQLIVAGKAHPEDIAGQSMIQEWIRFVRQPEIRPRAVFLADYDMLMAENLVHGIDVWINVPRRPWEASGTSGMKVLVNGGLNLSELDGWWAEAYSPDIGWALGDGREHGDDPKWDAQEAEALYTLLEQQVIPEFYARQDGLPVGWLARVRRSMARLTPAFSANRVVREYTVRHYIPGASLYAQRAAEQAHAAGDILQWREALAERWAGLRLGHLAVDRRGDSWLFQVEAHLAHIDPGSIRVEVYANGLDGAEPFRQPMDRGEQVAGAPDTVTYSALVPADRPSGDYTPRIVAWRAGVSVPLECGLIRWLER